MMTQNTHSSSRFNYQTTNRFGNDYRGRGSISGDISANTVTGTPPSLVRQTGID